jgi:hypothetical protein
MDDPGDSLFQVGNDLADEMQIAAQLPLLVILGQKSIGLAFLGLLEVVNKSGEVGGFELPLHRNGLHQLRNGSSTVRVVMAVVLDLSVY